MYQKLLCAMLAIWMVFTPVHAIDQGGTASAGQMEESTYAQEAPRVKAPEGPVYIGVDVSVYQEKIDWETAREHIDFAILRCGYGRNLTYQDDSRWIENASECTRLGIPFGVYLYSYAESDEQAYSEAAHVLRLLEGYNPSLPIYLDLEDEKTVALQSNANIYRHARIFCDIIENAGYRAGIYSNHYWWTNFLLDPGYGDWSRWMAAWRSTPPPYDKPYDVWQFTSTGTVPGIQGPVDMNYWFGELPNLEQSNTLETTPPTCTEPGYTTITPPSGEPYRTRYVGALGHEYVKKVCTRCGAAAPAACDGGENCLGSVFEDLSEVGAWAHKGIDFCLENKLMKGVSEDRLNPNGTLSCAQLVTILYRVANSPHVRYTGRFTDVPEGHWYTKAIEWAAENDIVSGVGDGRFDPDGEITREQLAVILCRHTEGAWIAGCLDRFPDRREVSDYAFDAMVWATSEGILDGVVENGVLRLAPRDAVTRAQAATIIMRYQEKFGALH